MNLVELEAFFPDIEPELPRCPVPVIENRIRDAIIDACERANIWRWQHPEILVIAGQQDYDLLTPTADTLIHSILDLKINGRSIDGCNDVDTHDGYVEARSGFAIADRGQIHLTSNPIRSSTPIRAQIAPIVPNEPVDPGGLFDIALNPTSGSSSTLVEYDMPVRTLALNGPASFAEPYTFDIVGGLVPLTGAPFSGFIADFRGVDLQSVIDQRGEGSIVGFRNEGVIGSGETLYVNHYYRDALVPANATNTVTIGNIKAAVDAGLPFLAIKFRTSFAGMASVFRASLEDFPPFYAIPSSPVNVGSWLRANTTTDRTLEFTSQNEFNAIAALPLHAHFSATGNTTGWSLSDQNNGLDVYFRATDPSTGDTLEYDVNFASGTEIASTWSAPSSLTIERLSARYRIDKLAAPNGERGLISLIDHDTETFNALFNNLPDDLLQAYADSPKTDDIAAYQAEFDTYSAALTLFNAWVAAENRPNKGVEPVVSIKPSRTTLHVSEVLWRDYYQLIVQGALAKAMMMVERPWSNPQMAKDYEMKYEYSLVKAKQGLDRGFRTGSQRIKPRKFA